MRWSATRRRGGHDAAWERGRGLHVWGWWMVMLMGDMEIILFFLGGNTGMKWLEKMDLMIREHFGATEMG
jgi:hypothetical protein